jgi:hypothetical protein
LIHDSQLPAISESTIYRLFLWGDKNNTPSITALDILSRFFGFQNWSKFEMHQQELDAFAQGFISLLCLNLLLLKWVFIRN